MSYLKMLREWENSTGDRGKPPHKRQRSVHISGYYQLGWWAIVMLNTEDSQGGLLHIHKLTLESSGKTRETACYNCYREAVKRGIIEEVPHADAT